MPSKGAGQGERTNPEAAASAFLSTVTCIPELQGNPEAAGRYAAAWLCLAHEAHQQAEPGLVAAVAYAVGRFGRTSTKEHYTVAGFAEKQLRWCLAALKDPSEVTPPLPRPPPSLEAIKADSVVLSTPPLSGENEWQRRRQLQQQLSLQRVEVEPATLACLLVTCWSSKREEDAAAAVCAWAASQWCSDRAEPPLWMDIHRFTAEGLARNLPPLLKAMQDGPLTGVLRSLHLVVLARPEHVVDAIQGYGAGALLDACAQMLGPSSKRSQAPRTAAAHFLAAIAWPTFVHHTNRQMEMWLQRWPAVTVECCTLLERDLGAYNQHGGPEQQYAAWFSMLYAAHEAGRPWVPASTLAAARPGRAVVRLLSACLEPVPHIKRVDIGDYYSMLKDPFDSPGKQLSGPYHLMCLRDCLRCMNFFIGHRTLFDEMLAAGLEEELHSLFSRQVPAAVLEGACLLLGMLARKSDGFPELLDYAVDLTRGHYLRVCREESQIYGVPYALCQWAKSGHEAILCLTWGSDLALKLQPALAQRSPGLPVVSAPSKRFGLSALLWLVGCSEVMWDRLLSAELLAGIVAEVDEIVRQVPEFEGELDQDGKPLWSVGALELLEAVVYVLARPEAARALLKFGLLDGVLDLMCDGWFDEDSIFLPSLLALMVKATSDDDFLATCQESPQLTRVLLAGLDRAVTNVSVSAQARTVTVIPPCTSPLLQLLAVIWGPDTAIDVPHAPDRKRLVKHVSMVAAALWEACEETYGLSEARAVMKTLCSVLVMLDFLDVEPLPPSAAPLAQLMRTTLKREADYGSSHFKDHSDQCGHCMHHFGQNLDKLMTAIEYFTDYDYYLPVLAAAKIPLELDRLCHVIRRHLSQETWASAMLSALQGSIDTIREGELRARKARKQGSAAERPPKRVQDLSAAEAAARKAEAELLAEVEAEKRQQQKKKGVGQEGQAQKGGGKAGKKGKGKKKQKGGSAQQQPARARAASPASEGQSESEDDGAASSLAVPQVNTSVLDASKIAARLTAGSRGSMNGISGAAEEQAGTVAAATTGPGPAGGGEGAQDEAVEGYLEMIAQLEAEAEEETGEDPSWLLAEQRPGMRHAGPSHGNGSSWEAAAGAEGVQGGRKGRVMILPRPASAKHADVMVQQQLRGRQQQQQRQQQPLLAGRGSPPQPLPIIRPHSAPESLAPAEAGSSAMDGSRLLWLLQHAPPTQQASRQAVQQAQQAQQAQQQPGFPVGSHSAMQAAVPLPPMQPLPAVAAAHAEHDMAAGDDLDAIMPWLVPSIPQQQQQQQQVVGTPQKQAQVPKQPGQGSSSSVASPLSDLLHQLLPPEGSSNTLQGEQQLGAGRVASVGREPGPALRQVLSCPLNKAPFADPVIAEDGATYERAAIWGHIQQGGTSPLTGQPLLLDRLRPNHAVRAAVEALLLLPHH